MSEIPFGDAAQSIRRKEIHFVSKFVSLCKAHWRSGYRIGDALCQNASPMTLIGDTFCQNASFPLSVAARLAFPLCATEVVRRQEPRSSGGACSWPAAWALAPAPTTNANMPSRPPQCEMDTTAPGWTTEPNVLF